MSSGLHSETWPFEPYELPNTGLKVRQQGVSHDAFVESVITSRSLVFSRSLLRRLFTRIRMFLSSYLLFALSVRKAFLSELPVDPQNDHPRPPRCSSTRSRAYHFNQSLSELGIAGLSGHTSSITTAFPRMHTCPQGVFSPFGPTSTASSSTILR